MAEYENPTSVNETESQELSYHETLALLPAYAAGQLGDAAQAAVDDYLQRQISLFRRLDDLEEAAGRNRTAAMYQAQEQPEEARFVDDPYAQVMEGYSPPAQLADNPLLMRTAPQAYVDPDTGQRYVIPRRDGDPERPFDARVQQRNRARFQGFWSLLALATVLGVILIALYQRNLQQTIAGTQTTLDRYTTQMSIVSGANYALALRSADQATQGTLLVEGNQALLSVRGLGVANDGRRYQLWVRTADSSFVPAAQLTVETDRPTQWYTVDLPTGNAELLWAGISLEPAAGSAQPTSPMLVESAPG